MSQEVYRVSGQVSRNPNLLAAHSVYKYKMRKLPSASWLVLVAVGAAAALVVATTRKQKPARLSDRLERAAEELERRLAPSLN